ncbi:uncharacterized protein LOC125601010 [Brassica napus]|nr:uncharacterized protein LOC125601010 [Brassica napus]
MENKDLMNFLRPTLLQLRMKLTMTTNLNFLARLNEEDSEEKPIQLMEILRDMKLKAVQMMENVSSYFGGLFRTRLSQRVDRRGRDVAQRPYYSLWISCLRYFHGSSETC